jgi:hypothetical protein
MSYVLGSTDNKVQWYRFMGWGAVAGLEVHDVLDLKATQPFASKDDAKKAAIAAGLRSWRYFKF